MKQINIFTKEDIEQIVHEAVGRKLVALEGRLRTEFRLRILADRKEDQLDKDLVESLQLPFRAENRLDRFGIKTLQQLTQLSESDLLHIHGLGRKTLRDIKDALAIRGIGLSEDGVGITYFTGSFPNGEKSLAPSN